MQILRETKFMRRIQEVYRYVIRNTETSHIDALVGDGLGSAVGGDVGLGLGASVGLGVGGPTDTVFAA